VSDLSCFWLFSGAGQGCKNLFSSPRPSITQPYQRCMVPLAPFALFADFAALDSFIKLSYLIE
jgi:hypothetical protein